MGAGLALKICGAFCVLRSLLYLISPNSLMDLVGYPPVAVAGSWGKKADGGPSAEDVQSVTLIVMMYALVQGGIGGLCLSTARVGDKYTMGVVSIMIGGLNALLVLFCLSKMNEPGYEFIGKVANKLVAPLGGLAVYMIYQGLTTLKAAKPAAQPIGKSGKMMGIVSVLSAVQGLGPIFFFDKWMSTFGLSIGHGSTEGIVKTLGPMWGMCIVVGSLTRLAVIRSAHTASIYAVCRAFAIYMAQLGAAIAFMKNLTNSNEAVGYQCWVITIYFFLTYFGGTLQDDTAAAAKKK